MLLSSATNNSAVFPQLPTYDPHCVVKEISISMQVTTATGFAPNFTNPSAQMGVCGAGVGFTGCIASPLYAFQSNASGTRLGTSCSDFVFDTTASTPFNGASPPAPPYSGTYQVDPGRSGVGDLWYLAGLQYEFSYVFNHPPDAMLECATIVITTQIVP